MRRRWLLVLAILAGSTALLLLQLGLMVRASSSAPGVALAAPMGDASVVSEATTSSVPDAIPLAETSQHDPAFRERVKHGPLNLPLRFIANEGQTDPGVRFIVKGAGHTIFFTEDEVVFGAEQGVEGETVRSVMRLRFPGSNPHSSIEGIGPLEGVVNYCLGNDRARWRANVPTYGAVAYRDLYPGVDLVYHGTEGYLKSEFRIAPGVDPSVILMSYRGVEALRLQDDGALVLETALGELIETAPLVYQETNGVRREITGGYVLRGANRVGFDVGSHDRSQPLVIDPALVYSSYLGGSECCTYAMDIAVDASGNIYLTGDTSATDFPTTTNAIQTAVAGNQDVFVTKLVSATGVYTYGFSTYLGGSDGERGYGIALDGDGDVYVTGYTGSTDFPATTNAIQPATPYAGGIQGFVTVIGSGGGCSLDYSSYLGGHDDSQGNGIAPDGDAGDFYVAGETRASDFPTTTNAIKTQKPGTTLDTFVTHIVKHTGVYTYAYSTYLGGSHHDYALGMAVDGDDSIYLAGYVQSTDFPTTADALQSVHGGGTIDAFVTKLITASGVYTYGYSSYLGGSSTEIGHDIALDSQGNVYVTGYTLSANFPTHNAIDTTLGGFKDAFVTNIILHGTPAYGYSTYVGGSGYEEGHGITVDGEGSAYVTGETESSNFPTPNAIDATLGGSRDAFVTKIISTPVGYDYGYSTYLGGSGGEEGHSIAVPAADNVYVTGHTGSTDFPTRNAIDPSGGAGYYDSFVVKIAGPADLALTKAGTPTGVIGPGQSITYTLVYTNEGQTKASGVLITDIVPITLTNVSFTSSGAEITPTGAVSYTWEVEDLASAEGGLITITGVVSTPLAGDSTLTNQATIASTDTYYADENPANDASVVQNLVHAEPPPAPMLLTPPNGAVMSDTTPTLIWGTSPEAVGYLLDWSGTVMDMYGATQYTTSILADDVYTWTVAAYDSVGNTSAYTDVWSLTVDTMPPAPPTLLSPANGAIISETSTPTLMWGASVDAAGYLLDWDGTVMDMGGATQYTTPGLAEGIYSWTAAAYDSVRNTSAYTDNWEFTIVTPITTEVGPSQEGTIVYTDSQGLTTTLEIPAGSVSDTTTLVYTAILSPTELPGDFEFAGHAFSLDAFRDGQPLPGFDFETCVTITIHYSDEDVAGLAEDTITLKYWDGSAWVDAEICDPPGYVRDLDNVIQIPIPHLSDFALAGTSERKFYVPLVMKNY